jgi:hypothetical protein
LDIAFVYIAEAYQCYHGAAIGIELAKRPNVRVTCFYADPDTPRHLRRIHRAFGAPPPVTVRLRESIATNTVRGLQYLGVFKHRVLRDNREDLNHFDAIISVENTVAMAREEGINHPKLIYTPHGFGDRAYAFVPRISRFDFVLVAGDKTEQRMLAKGLIRPGAYALTGSVKLETGARLEQSEAPLFAEPRPTTLYNPHFDPKLTSWNAFIGPIMQEFEDQQAFNLIAAPHVKLFRRSSETSKARWRSRSTPSIIVDPGSDRSIDSSSQVYEFLARPRPCLFLNAHGADWRDNPDYVHWHLGDVIADPSTLMAAIRAAPERHPLYVKRQEAARRATLGQAGGRPSVRAAEAIMNFLERR